MKTIVILLLLAVIIGGPAWTISTLDHGRDVLLPAARDATRHAVDAVGCDRRHRPVVINLPNWRDRHILDHAWDAIRAGKPRVLTLDRSGADENRNESLAGVPTRPGYDRDEYPPAVSAQGGEGADVRYVRSAENRSAGASMGAQLSGWCDGQRFRYERRP